MKELYDQVSQKCSKLVTENYSTSFKLATKMLATEIREDMFNSNLALIVEQREIVKLLGRVH